MPELTPTAALISALGIIAMLVKFLILDVRRRKNGHGHVTREELVAAVKGLTEHLDEKAEYLNEKIEKISLRVEGLHARRGEFASAETMLDLHRRVGIIEQQLRDRRRRG